MSVNQEILGGRWLAQLAIIGLCLSLIAIPWFFRCLLHGLDYCRSDSRHDAFALL